jgi:predicted DNA-binding ribbon-helix-helix protein
MPVVMSFRWLVLFVAALSSAHAEADSSPSKIEGGRAMKSSVTKHSVHPAGHKTSVSLEDAFWNGLKEIADGRYITSSELIAEIDAGRQHGNLSSAVRLFVLDFYRYRLLEEAEIAASVRPLPLSLRLTATCFWCSASSARAAQPLSRPPLIPMRVPSCAT